MHDSEQCRIYTVCAYPHTHTLTWHTTFTDHNIYFIFIVDLSAWFSLGHLFVLFLPSNIHEFQHRNLFQTGIQKKETESPKPPTTATANRKPLFALRC